MTNKLLCRRRKAAQELVAEDTADPAAADQQAKPAAKRGKAIPRCCVMDRSCVERILIMIVCCYTAPSGQDSSAARTCIIMHHDAAPDFVQMWSSFCGSCPTGLNVSAKSDGMRLIVQPSPLELSGH